MSASEAVRIYGLPLLNKNGHQRAGERRPLYEARLGSFDGPVLVKSTVQPLLDGARVLLAQGVTGRVELWGGEPYPRMSGEIEVVALWTVKETRNIGPVLRRWKPFPESPRLQE